MMRVGINQPYLFPYLGYFQLVNTVDTFVFLDDSTFIKGGWINRNFVLLNGEKFLFSVPLNKLSSNKLINDTELNSETYQKWWMKFSRSIEQSYKKAPFFEPVFEMINDVLSHPESKSISILSARSVEAVLNYLSVHTQLEFSSHIPLNKTLKAEDRILEICILKKADVYVNLPGGIDLYSKEHFFKKNIELKFINPETVDYRQFSNDFIPNLSILDVLMFNSKEEVRKMLDQFSYIEN